MESTFYEWKPEYKGPVIAIISAAIGFACYWFIALSGKIRKLIFEKFSTEKAWITFVSFQKMTGVLFLGILPGLVLLANSDYTFSQLGMNLGHLDDSLMYTGIMGLLILILNYFASKNPFGLSMYPQMRIKSWTSGPILINTLSWTAYLLAYEFMFRGILLIVCYDAFGFWPAVAINLSFYSATHIPKGLAETVAAFPYGLILCFITISTGSVAVSFLTHLILALSNDYFSVYHSTEMEFK